MAFCVCLFVSARAHVRGCLCAQRMERRQSPCLSPDAGQCASSSGCLLLRETRLKSEIRAFSVCVTGSLTPLSLFFSAVLCARPCAHVCACVCAYVRVCHPFCYLEVQEGQYGDKSLLRKMRLGTPHKQGAAKKYIHGTCANVLKYKIVIFVIKKNCSSS